MIVNKASMNLRIYDINFGNNEDDGNRYYINGVNDNNSSSNNNHYSILEFASPIVITDIASGVERRKISLNGNKNNYGKYVLRISPGGYFIPNFGNSKQFSSRRDEDYYYYNTSCAYISSFDEYLFYDCSPERLKLILKVILFKNPASPKKGKAVDYVLDLHIEIEKNNINLKHLSNKMFPSWKSHAERICRNRREIGHRITPFEDLKLKECASVMEKLVKRGFKTERDKIKSLTSDRHSRISKFFERELKNTLWDCRRFIFSFSEIRRGCEKRH